MFFLHRILWFLLAPHQSGRKQARVLAGPIFFVFIVIIIGCAPPGKDSSSPLSGTFKGKTSDGSHFTVTFDKKENSVSGHGMIGDRNFSLSAVTSWHGPMVVAFEEGNTGLGHVTISADGENATLELFGEQVKLERGGEPVHVSSGRFEGQYFIKKPLPLKLILNQSGDLLAGTGIYNGKPVAVAGKVTGPELAEGYIMFPDESRKRVEAFLSDDGKTITVKGLGADIKLKRTGL